MCNDDGTPADHDRGLSHDLTTLHAQHERRGVLRLIGTGAGVVAGGALLTSGLATSADAATTTEIPNETAGPYPGDGSNGPDVLEQRGVVRRDIRRSFGGPTTLARGVPLTFVLRLRSTSTGKPVKGLAVYAWRCDAAGESSMNSAGIEDENYLRGVQVSGSKGRVRFVSIFPGCCSGRWPHIHFEVCRTRRTALGGGTPLAASQLALPRQEAARVDACSSHSAGSSTNLDRISLRSDNVFGDDGGARQLATTSGSLSQCYQAVLAVPVDL